MPKGVYERRPRLQMQRELPDPLPQTVSDLGALIYYREAGTDTQFEALGSEQKTVYWIKAIEMLEMLAKLNKVVIDKNKLPEAEPREIRLDKARDAIALVVRQIESTRPEHFPTDELAHKVLEALDG